MNRYQTFGAILLFIVGGFALTQLAFSSPQVSQKRYFVHLKLKNKMERTYVQRLGMSIDSIIEDSVYGTATPAVIEKLKKHHAPIVEVFEINQSTVKDFPTDDGRFHNYAELTEEMQKIAASNPSVFHLFSIGKTTEGREIWCMQVNTTPLRGRVSSNRFSAKPGIVFIGNHHAREHVSAEIPLMALQFLAANYEKDPIVTNLMQTRDIYFIPMVNPDGVEYDIKGNKYHMHRKNMRNNGGGSYGVDLNRNYGFGWNTGGSSTNPDSDVYMGPAPFSEPESMAVKNFVDARPNLKILLSFHTFSELILYPWGHLYDPIPNAKDLAVYKTMAKKMSEWNGYRPEQSSDLYIASGDTTDWSYGVHGIFSFTFELSPKSIWGGGFYPGAKILDKVFAANLKPMLYMMEMSDNPYKSLRTRNESIAWLENVY